MSLVEFQELTLPGLVYLTLEARVCKCSYTLIVVHYGCISLFLKRKSQSLYQSLKAHIEAEETHKAIANHYYWSEV